MIETLEGWLELVADRLGPETLCLMAPGNDDPPFVDDVLARAGDDVVVDPEGRLVELPGGFELISVGTSNLTPWTHRGSCPRTRSAR